MTATLIQLLIQRRITTLSNLYLAKRDQLPNIDDVEAGATKKHQMDTRTWLMPFLLFFGLSASVVFCLWDTSDVLALFRVRHRRSVPLVGSARKPGFL